ncbi:giy-yig endonuclease superfamily [Holotrichia oblita]|uniref:Giy-yig endonuclease superfamily n=1 Tax=Holotrichia oblita TaxID=644536 RepID=A0ACB9TIP8_HOLOL|nr:giy-yig endonuclease superfamily [Holotrichia oblita]
MDEFKVVIDSATIEEILRRNSMHFKEDISFKNNRIRYGQINSSVSYLHVLQDVRQYGRMVSKLHTSSVNPDSHAAKCNGFQPQHIYKLIRKFNYKKTVKKSTTFREDVKASPVVTLPYAPFITKGLSKIFKELDLRIVYSSGTSLRNLIGNPKDKIQPLEKSGIYEINCKDCNQKYIGQTRRAVSTRFKEHMANLRFNRTEKSSVAQHIFETDHNIDHTNVKLIRQINNNYTVSNPPVISTVISSIPFTLPETIYQRLEQITAHPEVGYRNSVRCNVVVPKQCGEISRNNGRSRVKDNYAIMDTDICIMS